MVMAIGEMMTKRLTLIVRTVIIAGYI
jgi:hypothetical protein